MLQSRGALSDGRFVSQKTGHKLMSTYISERDNLEYKVTICLKNAGLKLMSKLCECAWRTGKHSVKNPGLKLMS
jgi:hypothetical protein